MKRILAIVLSIVILVMAFPFSVFAAPVVATDTWDGTMTEPTTTDESGNIVINTAEELAWVALGAGTATQGKSYIVTKGSVFDMAGMEGITPDSSTADVKNATKTSILWRSAADNKDCQFVGNFDGNGLVVYNLYTSTGRAYGGLFPVVKPVSSGSVSVKNITVKASHIGGYHAAAGIIGLADAPDTSTSLSLENCAVENCYIYDNNDTSSATQKNVSAVVGQLTHNGTIMNNILVVDNEFSAQGVIGGLFGNTSNYGGAVTVSNAVVVGSSVEPVSVGYAFGSKVASATYTNVYTDQSATKDGIISLTKDQMQGSAAKNNIAFKWGITWELGAEGKYPSIIFDSSFYDEWDGTFAEPTKTDADGNIIIASAEEMAWVALRGAAATNGKSYKVADGFKYFNMNGAVDITVDSTAAEVQTAAKTANNWRYATDGGNAYGFQGNFDGNGVTIYNIYAAGYGHGALFPYIYNNSTIKNVIVKASFISGYHHAAGIVGTSEIRDTTVNIDKCQVENCYITDNGNQNAACKRAASQFIAATGNSNLNISNSIAINNTISAAGYEAGFVAQSGDYITTGISIKNSISIGFTPYSNVKIGALGNGLTSQLTVENVYSDVESNFDGFTTLTAEQMQGAAAKENMDLKWDILWKAGAEGEYPSIIFDSSFYDEWDGSFVEPTKTDADGNIIIASAEEMAWVALRGDVATDGKSYKVADGIKYFNMNGMSGITFDSTVADVKAADKNEAFAWRYAADGKTGTFYGNFDGNGVTIYNMYSAAGRGYAGLFPAVKPASGSSITIKNVAVIASYFGAYHNAGGIIGLADAPDTSTKLSLEGLVVKNTYICDNNDQNAACQRTTGTIAGQLTHNATTINNCLVVDNELSAQGIIGGLFGNTSLYGGANAVTNVISVGTSVQPIQVEYAISSKAVTYANIYTDQAASADGITVLTVDKMQGAAALENMSALDDAVWFFNTTTYPELYTFHNVVDGVCDCGLELAVGAPDDDECTHIAGEAVEENRVEATCSAAGSYDLVVYCTECEEEISRETVAIEKLAHTAGEAVEENRVAATCVAEGSYDLVVYCEVCGEEISRTTETIAIDKDAHAFDDENDIDCNNGCGYVTLIYGDANGDGTINARDCALVMQYINDWDVASMINITAADVNGDAVVNAKDYAMMIQFINDWDVVLGPTA